MSTHALLIDRIGEYLAKSQEGYQTVNFRRHLLAAAFVLSAKNGIGTKDNAVYAESKIRALLWAMEGVDYYKENPTSKSHQSPWRWVAFAFDLADRLVKDHGTTSSFLYETLAGADSEQAMADAVITLLRDKHPLGVFASVAGIRSFMDDQSKPKATGGGAPRKTEKSGGTEKDSTPDLAAGSEKDSTPDLAAGSETPIPVEDAFRNWVASCEDVDALVAMSTLIDARVEALLLAARSAEVPAEVPAEDIADVA